MGRNSHYWVYKEVAAQEAKDKTKSREVTFHNEIDTCVGMSKLYGGPDFRPIDVNNYNTLTTPPVFFFHQTTTETIRTIRSTVACEVANVKICALNFASYKNPGGSFLDGSIAQEESLCHQSILYNVLSKYEDTYYEYNRKHLKRALYEDRAIYSPDVLFFPESHPTPCDVLTCAAPNAGAYLRYNKDSSLVDDAVRDRIEFLMDIADTNGVEIMIIGAYGCGVFRNKPEQIAREFARVMKRGFANIKDVIVSIPDDKDGSDKTLQIFKENIMSIYPDRKDDEDGRSKEI